MNEGKQKTVEGMGLYSRRKSEALRAEVKVADSFIAECQTESPTGTDRLMEEVCKRDNLEKALKRVKANKGSAGVDGMRVEELAGHLKANWEGIREQIMTGAYKPSPVRSVEISKPDGGTRKLGIPTVTDRFIQQAILQTLQVIYDKTFSRYSYGFRPNKSAQQAVMQARKYISEGYCHVVDIDLEKFFDKVNHDRLMSRLAKGIKDKRMLKIIRAYLNAGVMENGLVKAMMEGTPQGGNLSPFLSNIVLDELDKELEERGHRFVRYADDCNIYVRSARAGERVMESISRYITRRLKLKVNQEKSAVDKPSKRKFLGYSFTKEKEPRVRISPKSLMRFKDRIKDITRRNRGVSVSVVMRELNGYIRGWMGYYCYCQTLSVLKNLDSWIRRRMRCYIWKKWKTTRRRVTELMNRGLERNHAFAIAYKKGFWAVSWSEGLQRALPNVYFDTLGYISLTKFVKV